MRKKYLFFLVIFLFPLQVFAVSDTSYSSIVMDTSSKRVLYENNAHEVRSVASISKIMTALLAIEKLG